MLLWASSHVVLHEVKVSADKCWALSCPASVADSDLVSRLPTSGFLVEQRHNELSFFRVGQGLVCSIICPIAFSGNAINADISN